MTRPGSWTRALQAGQASLEMDDALIAMHCFAPEAGEVHFDISAQQQLQLSDSGILDTGDSVEGRGVVYLNLVK